MEDVDYDKKEIKILLGQNCGTVSGKLSDQLT